MNRNVNLKHNSVEEYMAQPPQKNKVVSNQTEGGLKLWIRPSKL